MIKLYVTPLGHRVGEHEPETLGPNYANRCHVPDRGIWCGSQLSTGYFVCTRNKHHNGPHIAHRYGAEVCGIWVDYHPSLQVSEGL